MANEKVSGMDPAAALTGAELLELVQSGDNVQSTVGAIVDLVVDAAPGTLNTLNELAAALGDDANYAATITTALGLKAPLASPALTGTPTVPTAAQGTNTTQAASTAYVQTEAGLLIPKSLIDAKGDLLVGTADNTVTRRAVGANDTVLTADSGQTDGVKWATVLSLLGTLAIAAGGTGQTTQPAALAAMLGHPLLAKASSDALSNNTMVADGTLTAAIAASEKVLVMGLISYDGNSTADFQAALEWPASPNAARVLWIFGNAAIGSATPATVFGLQTASGVKVGTMGAVGVGTPMPALFFGYIDNGANAGNIAVDRAQAVTDATASNILAGSVMALFRFA